MINLLSLHKYFITPHIKEGGIAVDFTMGNGHDTLWLSSVIGDKGHVYSFDIQKQALESTRKLLDENNALNNCTLICDSHANVKNYVKEKICAGVFNLGYLPGGDKSITTKRESTLMAVDSAVELLDNDGIILIAVYPGHPEGELEGKMLSDHLSNLSRFKFCVSRFQVINSPTSPYFIMVESK